MPSNPMRTRKVTTAAATGISYDTLLRIRENRADPAFGKVQQLAVYFRVVRR